MSWRRAASIVIVVAAMPLSARVIYVDNRAATAGDGSAERPYATIAEGSRASSDGDILYVMETSQPYAESVVLRHGQQLLGSAAGVIEPPIAPLKGPGPEIHGTIASGGDNVIAGCTLVADRAAAIAAIGVTGTLTINAVYFKTSNGGFAVWLTEQMGRVVISGGSIVAASQGGGLGFERGMGEIVVERCPMLGDFAAVLRVSGRSGGAITFRRGTKLRIDRSSLDAIDLEDLDRRAPVVFEDSLAVSAQGRAFVARNVGKVTAHEATLHSVNAAALEVRDSEVDLELQSVSAEGVAPKTLEEGVVIDRVRGKIAIAGGAIANARGNGIHVAQTSNVRISGVTISGSGTNARIKNVRCAGGFESVSTAICHAALYLRHVTSSAFVNIVVDGGGAMGINANNVRDVAFDHVEVRAAGDETFESGALLQEIGGTVSFANCRFADNAGSELLIEQRFNSGRVTFDHCDFTAPKRPEIARQLIETHVSDAGKLSIEVHDSDLRDSIGYAVLGSAAQSSELALSISGTTLHHFGDGVVSLAAADDAHASLAARGNQIAAPAVIGVHPWIAVAASGRAVACVDAAGNRFDGLEGDAIRLSASTSAQLRLVSAIDAAALAAANGGASSRIDAAPASLSTVSACH